MKYIYEMQTTHITEHQEQQIPHNMWNLLQFHKKHSSDTAELSEQRKLQTEQFFAIMTETWKGITSLGMKKYFAMPYHFLQKKKKIRSEQNTYK